MKKLLIGQPGSSAQSCMKCGQPYYLFVRRHHCRSFGCVTCSNCLTNKIIVKNISLKKPVPVCKDCFEKLKNVIE